jgi:transposase
VCGGCGAGLAGAAAAGVARACQVTDIPLVTATVTEHRMHQARCCCGLLATAAPPPEAASGTSRVYGPNLRALVVYLLAYQQLPVERAARLIADVTGAAPSTGFVHGMLARSAAAVAEVVTAIKALITMAHVVGFDETTLRCGPAGRKRHILSASTEDYTVFHLGGRDLGSFTEFGILPTFTGIAVHDRYQNYYHPKWAHLGGHQACTAHLLRDFTDAAEAHPHALWPQQAQGALRGLIHAWNQARDSGLPQIPPADGDPLITSFRHAVRVGLSEVRPIPGPRNRTAQLPGRDLLEFCRDREPDVLRFCSDTQVWPTNNISERDLRPNKTQQKISGRLTSEDVTQDRLDIRSYIDTMRKHGANVMNGIRAALTGDPWRPPTPTPT